MAEKLHHRPQGHPGHRRVCLVAILFVSFLASEPWHSQFSGMTLDEIRAETIERTVRKLAVAAGAEDAL